MKHLIVDGLNFFIRSFTVNPSMDTNGAHVGGLVGFLMSLNKLVREIKPDNLIIIWDGEGGSWKRRSIYKDYKAGRKPKLNRQYDFDTPEDSMRSMREQLIKLKLFLKYLPLTSITIKGTEADDVIAYLWRFMIPKEDKKVIVSTDHDFWQLLDENTAMWIPTKKKFYTADEMSEDLKILPENYIYMKALMGDKSDNIPGLKGVGSKTVTKLFPFLSERIVEVEDIFEHCETNKTKSGKYGAILENRTLVINNMQLMQLTSPLMDPMATKTVRKLFDDSTPEYRPTDMKMQLLRDGLQIKASDFFVVFKEQLHRYNNSLS